MYALSPDSCTLLTYQTSATSTNNRNTTYLSFLQLAETSYGDCAETEDDHLSQDTS